MSEQPCYLYRAFDAEGQLLYVGISINAITRLGQHSSGSDWWTQVVRVEIETHEDRAAALEAEGVAIAAEAPLHNVAGSGRPRRSNISLTERRELTWSTERRVICSNCGDRPYRLDKGVLISEHECPNCGCAGTLYLDDSADRSAERRAA